MLVSCPECNKRISNHAESCPNCGHPINTKKPKGEGCFLQTLNIGCGMVIIGFIVVFLIAMGLSLMKFKPKEKLNESEKTEIKKSPKK